MRRGGTLGLVAVLLSLVAPAAPAAAQDLALPANAEMARELTDTSGTYALPVGPWSDGGAETLDVAGDVTRQAWRIGASSLTTQQLMDQLAAQLDREGYDTLLRCADAACGGFDFRFSLSVLPPPEMFVDLFDYRFLSARRAAGSEARYVTLLISRSGSAAYLQVTRVAPADGSGGPHAPGTPEPQGGPGTVTSTDATADDAASPSADKMQEDGALVSALRGRGRAVLTDLDFGTGAAGLGEGPFASLGALAAFLKGDAARRIALVGHTDTVGGYEDNLALSRRRADAVMQRLIDSYDVSSEQLEAEGIAYLAPRAPNTDAPGREANRRVEAVLLSAE
ncbi:MAG: OmpA family protein [Roseovarius sp.]